MQKIKNKKNQKKFKEMSHTLILYYIPEDHDNPDEPNGFA